MKYEVPEINISMFSMENIVTVSAATVAVMAVEEVVGVGNVVRGTATANGMDGWVRMEQ